MGTACYVHFASWAGLAGETAAPPPCPGAFCPPPPSCTPVVVHAFIKSPSMANICPHMPLAPRRECLAPPMCLGRCVGRAKFGSVTALAVLRIRQCHRRQFGSYEFGVSRLWQCHGQQFDSAKFGSATDSTVLRIQQ